MRMGLTSLAWIAALAAMSPAQAVEPPMDASNNRWVEVTAQLDPKFVRPGGDATDQPNAVMSVHSIKPIDEPSEPYETLR